MRATKVVDKGTMATQPGEGRIEVDGSVMEGGGQIVRNATSFSALLRKPITVVNVRGKRSSPGLKAQHSTGILLAAEICSAVTTGVARQSHSYTFDPNDIICGDYIGDTGTAGSISLLLQTALPCLLFAKPREASHPHIPSQATSRLILKGGSNVINSPQFEYIQHVLFPFLRKHFGLTDVRAKLITRGVWPRGGGCVHVSVPALARGLSLEGINVTDRGEILCVRAVAYDGSASGRAVAEMRQAAVCKLSSLAEVSASILRSLPLDQFDLTVDASANSKARSGFGIVVWVETTSGCVLAGSAVGENRKTPSEVGAEAAEHLFRNLLHGGCVDEYLQDQIIIFLALAKGKSCISTGPLTEHTRTAIWIAESLSDAKFQVRTTNNGMTTIYCDGIGLEGGFDANLLINE